MKSKLLSCLVFIITFLLFSNQLSAQELWGMTWNGGGSSGDKGVIFSYNLATNSYSNKLLFDGVNTGRKPMGGLLQANNSNLYGMTFYGGTSDKGVLFKFDPTSNTLTKLVDFDGVNGGFPEGNVMQANDGNLYGLTNGGGASDKGVMFKYDLATDTYTKLVTFDGNNGAFPKGNLIQASNGMLYGTTSKGDTNDYSVVFSYNLSASTYQVIKIFDGSTSGYPRAGLMQATNGKLYGLTSTGIGSAIEILYEIDPTTNSFTKKAEFTGANGAIPTGDLIELSGNLYGLTFSGGTTQGGTLFQYNLNSGILTKKLDFTLNGKDGYYPSGTLTLSSTGKIYGTASQGGQNQYGSFIDNGVLFSYDPATNTYTNLYNFDGFFTEAGHGPLGNMIEVVMPETITISDTNFEQALIDLGYDTNGLSGNILKSEAESITSLDVSSPLTNPSLPNVTSKISDLRGIEGFVNLTTLNVSDNSLISLDISHNINLLNLDVSHNILSGLDVSQNLGLQTLTANNNGMINFDISLNTNLTNLNISKNSFDRVNLKNGHNTSITSFDIRNNNTLTCVTVDDVAYANTHFTNKDAGLAYSLNCDDTWTIYTPDTSLAGALNVIAGLDLNGDFSISLAEAAAFIGTLDLSGTGITDPTGLEAFTGISELNLNNNNITDLTSLINSGVIVIASKTTGNKAYKIRNFNGLSSLNINHNQLTSLDVSTLTSLVNLDVSYNNLTDLNIKNGNNLNLVNLNALSNSLTCIETDSNVIGFIPLGWQVDNSASFSANCTAATLSVESNLLNNQISIYPNPVQGLIYIDKNLDVKINKLSIYNIVGGLVKQFKPSQTELQINELPTGVYLLKIETNQGNISKKIIKE
jgi:uncharacterized repeat protein (TIGR03803 family)